MSLCISVLLFSTCNMSCSVYLILKLIPQAGSVGLISGTLVAHLEVVYQVCASQSYYIYILNLQYILYHLSDIELNYRHSGVLAGILQTIIC
jgi:hypothetical protein